MFRERSPGVGALRQCTCPCPSRCVQHVFLHCLAGWYESTTTPELNVLVSTSLSTFFSLPSRKRRFPLPRITGWTMSRYSSWKGPGPWLFHDSIQRHVLGSNDFSHDILLLSSKRCACNVHVKTVVCADSVAPAAEVTLRRRAFCCLFTSSSLARLKREQGETQTHDL